MLTGKNALLGCLFFVFLGFVFLAGCLWLSWGPFVRFAITDDLLEYQKKVRASNLDPEATRVLDMRLDTLRDHVQASGYGLWDWLPHDEVIVEIFQDGQVTGDELERLDRELVRMEKGFKVEPQPLPVQAEAE